MNLCICVCRVFPSCWNKVAASQIFPIDIILFLFLDYCWEIVNILIYLTKYSKIVRLVNGAEDLLRDDILQN